MMSANEQYPDTTGLTFEKVWAALTKTSQALDKLEKTMQVSRQSAEENARQWDIQWKQSQERLDKQCAKADKQHAETDRQIKRTGKQLGELSNKLGLLVESFMSAGAIRRFNAIGYHFTKASTRVKIIDSTTERTRAEADVLLENGDAVIIIEVKTEPSLSDIQEHIRRLQIFREDRNKTFPNDDKKIYGAMAGGIFPEEVQEAALSAGFYVVRHRGDNVKITVPEGFVPKAF